MAPHAENQKPCSSKSEKKRIQDELLEKLKLEEEKEKKKLEKDVKRRAELEKIKNESLVRQAAHLIPLTKKKPTVQPKNTVMKSKPKSSTNKKQQIHSSEKKNNQSSSYEFNSCNTMLKSSAWNKPQHSENRFRHGSSSSENSWKRGDSRNYQSNSKYVPVSYSMWGDADECFPTLGAEAPVPQVNVWEERKCKREEIKALEPQNEYDEKAMLQKALALSLKEAAQEAEHKYKLEDEYRLQMKALEHNPEILEEFIVGDKCDVESHNVLKPTKEQEYSKQSFSRNVAISSFSQKEGSSSSGGARPKLNKIIDSFGGWGLKDTKKENFCGKLSDCVDNIMNEKLSKKTVKYNTLPNFQNEIFNNNEKNPGKDVNPWLFSDSEIVSPVVSDSWSTTSSKDEKKSPASDPVEYEVSYKETSTDIDDEEEEDKDEEFNFTSSISDYCNVTSMKKSYKFPKKEGQKVFDVWLDTAEESVPVSDGWDDEVVYDEKVNSSDISAENVKTNSSGFIDTVPVNHAVINCENSGGSFSNLKTNIVKEGKCDNISRKELDSLGVSTKAIKGTKDVSFDVDNYGKQNELSHSNILSQFESTYNYVIHDSSMTKDESAHAETFLSNDDIWSDKSSKSTVCSSATHNQHLPKTELTWNEEAVKFDPVEKSEMFSSVISSSEKDTPPILPPQPAPTMPVMKEVNQTFTTEVSGSDCTEQSPPILPPQMPSQYLYNPMFPGVNPMLGPGMDPITVRQMLMLSNPFFASQLLAMEQYYRALGMPVDMFSFPPQTMSNTPFPGIIGASGEQNTFPNTVNVNASHADNSQFLNRSVPVSGNQDSGFSEKPSMEYPPNFNKNGTVANASGILENNVQDSWYSNLLSNESALIPPPKPATSKIDDQINSVHICEPSEPSQSASSMNHNVNTSQYMCGNSSSDLSVKGHKPLRAVESCITKTEITGWGDLEDVSFDNCNHETNTWDDDGWGTDNLPAKSVKNTSVYEDKKKVVHRQPARQPQLRSFQNKRKI